MSTLDEITKEKQRLSEALGRVDAQREKLVGQLGELEATERVLARYSKGPPTQKTTSARTPMTATNTAAPPRSGRRPCTAARPCPGDGETQQEITAACKGARPNHVGAAISRHKRAGHIEERDGKLYAT